MNLFLLFCCCFVVFTCWQRSFCFASQPPSEAGSRQLCPAQQTATPRTSVAVRCARLQQLCYCYWCRQQSLIATPQHNKVVQGCDQRSLPAKQEVGSYATLELRSKIATGLLRQQEVGSYAQHNKVVQGCDQRSLPAKQAGLLLCSFYLLVAIFDCNLAQLCYARLLLCSNSHKVKTNRQQLQSKNQKASATEAATYFLLRQELARSKQQLQLIAKLSVQYKLHTLISKALERSNKHD